MRHPWRRHRTAPPGLQMPVFGYGGAGIMLGGRREFDGRSEIGFRLPSDDETMQSLSGAWDAGIRYFDTR